MGRSWTSAPDCGAVRWVPRFFALERDASALARRSRRAEGAARRPRAAYAAAGGEVVEGDAEYAAWQKPSTSAPGRRPPAPCSARRRTASRPGAFPPGLAASSWEKSAL